MVISTKISLSSVITFILSFSFQYIRSLFLIEKKKEKEKDFTLYQNFQILKDQHRMKFGMLFRKA